VIVASNTCAGSRRESCAARLPVSAARFFRKIYLDVQQRIDIVRGVPGWGSGKKKVGEVPSEQAYLICLC
jgi:hypothetical protein